jgi:hypothetical protein
MLRILGMLAVAISAALFAYVAPPLGAALRMSLGDIVMSTMIGTALGAYVLVYASHWLLGKLIAGFYRLVDKPVPERSPAPQWLLDFVDRFGAPGLGLIGPVTIGGLAAGVLVPVLGIPRRKGAFWLAIGSSVTFGIYALMVAYAIRAF